MGEKGKEIKRRKLPVIKIVMQGLPRTELNVNVIIVGL